MAQDDICKLLKPVIENENIINPKIHALRKNDKGQGYLGEVSSVTIEGENKTINVIIKRASQCEHLRIQTPITDVYAAEINFYTSIYPKLRQFQLLSGDVKPFINVAKCYLTSDVLMEETLVFEDLNDTGYKTYDRQKLMDEEHITLVLEEYGRLHALSYALKNKNRELFRELTSTMCDTLLKFMDTKEYENLFNGVFMGVRDIFNQQTDTNILDALDEYHKNFIIYFRAISSENADEYAVIIHGDCWCNNMMFKYDNPLTPNAPTSMRLIDWQFQKLASPAADLSYFLFTCGGKKVFNNLDKYLKIYYKSLSLQLMKLDCDPENLLPFSILQDQWKKYAKYGMTMAFTVVRMMLADPEEAPDFNATKNGENALSVFDFKSKYEEKYKERIRDIVVHCYNYKVI